MPRTSRKSAGASARGVRTRFERNRMAGEQLKNGPAFHAGMRIIATAVQQGANAALRTSHRHGAIMPRPGHQASPVVLEDTDDGVAVVNTDYGAVITEFGSRHTPPEAPLRRGAQAAGLKHLLS